MDTITAEQFIKWRKSNGYSQDEAAKVLGKTERTVRGWEIGERSIPPLVAMVIKQEAGNA